MNLASCRGLYDDDTECGTDHMKTGILSAFGMESRPLRTRMEEIDRTEINGQVCYRLCCHDEELIVVQSGMGTRRAAKGTRLLIDRFGAQVVVNCGTAGAISPQRRIGDVVVSDQVVGYDAKLGLFAEMSVYQPHPALLGATLQISVSGPNPASLLSGTILSGDHIINSEEEKRRLWDQFQGQCAEQEGAGVARICQESHLPWIVIRGISDLADGNVRRGFQESARYAVNNAAEVAFRLVSLLISVPTWDHLEKTQDRIS